MAKLCSPLDEYLESAYLQRMAGGHEDEQDVTLLHLRVNPEGLGGGEDAEGPESLSCFIQRTFDWRSR